MYRSSNHADFAIFFSTNRVSVKVPELLWRCVPTHLVYTQICFGKGSECEKNWRYLVPQKGKNINVLCKKTSELLFSVVVRPLQMTLSIARQLLVLLLHVTAHALQQITKLTIPLPAQYLLNSVTPSYWNTCYMQLIRYIIVIQL